MFRQPCRLIQQLTDLNVAHLIDDELLDAGFTSEPPRRAERQLYVVIVLGFLLADDFPH